MMYEIIQRDSQRISFRTHPKARRGRGILFATMPFVAYLLAGSALFVLATQDLTLWTRVKSAALDGLGIAAFLAIGCFLLGRRVVDTLDADPTTICVRHIPALGATRTRDIRCSTVKALAIDPSLRSLGADVLLVAITIEGVRIPLAEGEPHSGQVRQLAVELASLTSLPLEAARFTHA